MFEVDGKEKVPSWTLALRQELPCALTPNVGVTFLPLASPSLQDQVPPILHIHRFFSS
jgi:hypothetical protein